MERIAVVVIGRNEGERLRRCLDSLLEQGITHLIYVDSGSTDGSVEMAESKGVEVVDLDMSRPFTMARGRNAGVQRLLRLPIEVEFLQFVDGDCEVEPTWIATALECLTRNPEVTAVCGFRRERFPEASVYNHLANMEWQGPVGEIDSCGGDAMYRLKAFRKSGGFNEQMIAGEEAELCARIRKAGGTILRLDAPMTRHDAAMTTFGQWWKRGVRSGHAFAEGYSLHCMAHHRRKILSAMSFGLLGPVGIAVGSAVLTPWLRPALWAAGAAAYAKSGFGAFQTRRSAGNTEQDAAIYAAFCVLGKFPEAQGVAQFMMNRVRGKRSSLIEYKNVPDSIR